MRSAWAGGLHLAFARRRNIAGGRKWAQLTHETLIRCGDRTPAGCYSRPYREV